MATVKFFSHGEICSNCLTSFAWVPNVAKRLPMLVLICQTVSSCLLCKIVIKGTLSFLPIVGQLLLAWALVLLGRRTDRCHFDFKFNNAEI